MLDMCSIQKWEDQKNPYNIRVRISSHWRKERNRLCLITLSMGVSFAIMLIKTTATTTTKRKDQKTVPSTRI